MGTPRTRSGIGRRGGAGDGAPTVAKNGAWADRRPTTCAPSGAKNQPRRRGASRRRRARGNLARGRDAALDPNARRARSRVARGVRGEIAGGRSEAPRAPGAVCAAGVETSGRDLARGAPSRVVLARTRSLVFELTPVDSLAQEFYLRRHRRHACAPWSRARSDAPPERPPLPHVEASGRSQSREFSRALEFPFYSN